MNGLTTSLEQAPSSTPSSAPTTATAISGGTRKGGKAKTSSRDLGGKPVIVMICGTLVYYHCAYRNSSLVSLVSDVFIVLLCSLAILGLLFRQMNIQVPVDPLEWQISQDAANSIFACLANTVGAAESVLRVAATGHDKRLFFKVGLPISSSSFNLHYTTALPNLYMF